MTKAEDLLKKVVDGQKKILEQMKKDRERVQRIEERLDRMEGKRAPQTSSPIQPALARVLKVLYDLDEPSSSDEVAKNVNLSRNLTSDYLNRLTRMGYVVKEPNLGQKSSARYVFRTNQGAIPPTIRKLISRQEE